MVARYAREAQQDASVRLLAEEIVSGLESKDYGSEILAIYYYVLANTRYANDPRNVELVKRPRFTAAQIARLIIDGRRPSLDCDDLVTIIAGLLLCLGRQVSIVTVAFRNAFFRGERQYSHVIIRVKEPRSGAWVILDPVAAEDTASMLRRVVHAKIWPIA
jgi:hypothetical protein